jgi:hypothetical protein
MGGQPIDFNSSAALNETTEGDGDSGIGENQRVAAVDLIRASTQGPRLENDEYLMASGIAGCIRTAQHESDLAS